jgi:GAG-pre-integrase domain
MTIPLDPGSNNVGTIHTATGYENALQTIKQKWEAARDLALDSLVIIPEIVPDLYPPESDDHGLPMEPHTPSGPHLLLEDEIVPGQREEPTPHDREGGMTPKTEGGREPIQPETEMIPDPKGESPRVIHQLVLPTKSENEAIDTKPRSKSDKREMRNRRLLKRWHERLGHVSMHTIQHMAVKGLLPSAIAKCKIPVCQECMYCMMTRKPWRTKAIPKPMSIVITNPGDCVSVDQLESKSPGLLGQLKGTPTKAR